MFFPLNQSPPELQEYFKIIEKHGKHVLNQMI